MFTPSHYRVAATMLAAYTLVLSWFVGERVSGGIRGGTVVKSEVTGLGQVTSWVQGGREVVYRAAEDKGHMLAILAAIALVLAVVAGVLEARRGLRNNESSLASETGGALFGGALFAMITGMPLALPLKYASPLVFWVVVLPYLALLFFLMCLFARWAETHA